MEAWRAIPNYPEWFVFYGEENFASCQLFKQKWEIQYLPNVLVNHRVEQKARKNNADYSIRLRRSLRSDWYNYFLFFPISAIPRLMAYSVWIQFRRKVFKGDLKALQAVVFGLMDLVWNMPRIIKNANRLTKKEYNNYIQLPEAKVYWQPETKE
jgi:GT2 family glycosyltransferase